MASSSNVPSDLTTGGTSPGRPSVDPPDGATAAPVEARGGDAGSGGEIQPATTASASPRRSVLADARFAWLVAALAALVAVVFGTLWAPLYTAERERRAVRAAAEEVALRLTTFEGGRMDAWQEDVAAVSTETYARQVARLFDQPLREALGQANFTSRGRVEHLFVQEIDGDDATVFAVVRQTVANDQLPQPVEDEPRMEIHLRRVGERWLANDVVILGARYPGGVLPGGAAQPPPAGATTPVPAPAVTTPAT